MNSRISRYMSKATLIAATLFGVCLSAVTTNAQSAFQAKVTIPYEVRWGKAELLPGNYILTMSGDSVRPVVVVRDAKTFRTVAVEPAGIEERSTKNESALLVGTRGQHQVVHSLRIAELGEVFIYDPALANERTVEEASKTRTVPVEIAEK
jgi:hypothetical protein